jgi:hypothetical protein
MSVYAVNKVCYRVTHEPELRRALAGTVQQRDRALRAASPPLADHELDALLSGDVGTLSRLGCNNFLLHQLGRWKLLGLDLPTYAQRIRAEYHAERTARRAPSQGLGPVPLRARREARNP